MLIYLTFIVAKMPLITLFNRPRVQTTLFSAFWVDDGAVTRVESTIVPRFKTILLPERTFTTVRK